MAKSSSKAGGADARGKSGAANPKDAKPTKVAWFFQNVHTQLGRDPKAYAVVLGALPTIVFIVTLAAFDYLASRAYYASAHDDSIFESYPDFDTRFEFVPYDYYSLNVYAPNGAETNWTSLDPIVQSRIWLRSLYPIERSGAEAHNVTTAVLSSTKLESKYKRTENSVELFSKTVSAGQHSDLQVYLEAYKACVEEKRCKPGKVQDQVVDMIHPSYLYPAAQLISTGQCSRARAVLRHSERLLQILDLSRSESPDTANLSRVLMALTEHKNCAKSYKLLEDQLNGIDCCYSTELDLATWPNEFSEFKKYGAAISLFESGNLDEAYREFAAIERTATTSLRDLARFMQVRSIFWSVVFQRRPELRVAAHTDGLVEGDGPEEAFQTRDVPISGLIEIELPEARRRIAELASGMQSSSSLLGDVAEYEQELMAYGDAR